MFIVVSGCSGAGKSTLVDVLESRGYPIVPEPGRRVVRQELATSGTALPWIDEVAFARKAMQLALEDMERAALFEGPVFFDRSLVDAASELEELTGAPTRMLLALTRIISSFFWHLRGQICSKQIVSVGTAMVLRWPNMTALAWPIRHWVTTCSCFPSPASLTEQTSS